MEQNQQIYEQKVMFEVRSPQFGPSVAVSSPTNTNLEATHDTPHQLVCSPNNGTREALKLLKSDMVNFPLDTYIDNDSLGPNAPVLSSNIQRTVRKTSSTIGQDNTQILTNPTHENKRGSQQVSSEAECGADLDYKDQMRLGENESAYLKGRKQLAMQPLKVDLRRSPQQNRAQEDSSAIEASKAPSPFYRSGDERSFEFDRQYNSVQEPVGEGLDVQQTNQSAKNKQENDVYLILQGDACAPSPKHMTRRVSPQHQRSPLTVTVQDSVDTLRNNRFDKSSKHFDAAMLEKPGITRISKSRMLRDQVELANYKGRNRQNVNNSTIEKRGSIHELSLLKSRTSATKQIQDPSAQDLQRDSAFRAIMPSPLDFSIGAGANYFNSGLPLMSHAIPTAPALSPAEIADDTARDGPFERFDSLKSLADSSLISTKPVMSKQSRLACVQPTTLTLDQLKHMPCNSERNWYLLQKARQKQHDIELKQMKILDRESMRYRNMNAALAVNNSLKDLSIDKRSKRVINKTSNGGSPKPQPESKVDLKVTITDLQPAMIMLQHEQTATDKNNHFRVTTQNLSHSSTARGTNSFLLPRITNETMQAPGSAAGTFSLAPPTEHEPTVANDEVKMSCKIPFDEQRALEEDKETMQVLQSTIASVKNEHQMRRRQVPKSMIQSSVPSVPSFARSYASNFYRQAQSGGGNSSTRQTFGAKAGSTGSGERFSFARNNSPKPTQPSNRSTNQDIIICQSNLNLAKGNREPSIHQKSSNLLNVEEALKRNSGQQKMESPKLNQTAPITPKDSPKGFLLPILPSLPQRKSRLTRLSAVQKQMMTEMKSRNKQITIRYASQGSSQRASDQGVTERNVEHLNRSTSTAFADTPSFIASQRSLAVEQENEAVPVNLSRDASMIKDRESPRPKAMRKYQLSISQLMKQCMRQNFKIERQKLIEKRQKQRYQRFMQSCDYAMLNLQAAQQSQDPLNEMLATTNRINKRIAEQEHMNSSGMHSLANNSMADMKLREQQGAFAIGMGVAVGIGTQISFDKRSEFRRSGGQSMMSLRSRQASKELAHNPSSFVNFDGSEHDAQFKLTPNFAHVIKSSRNIIPQILSQIETGEDYIGGNPRLEPLVKRIPNQNRLEVKTKIITETAQKRAETEEKDERIVNKTELLIAQGTGTATSAERTEGGPLTVGMSQEERLNVMKNCSSRPKFDIMNSSHANTPRGPSGLNPAINFKALRVERIETSNMQHLDFEDRVVKRSPSSKPKRHSMNIGGLNNKHNADLHNLTQMRSCRNRSKIKKKNGQSPKAANPGEPDFEKGEGVIGAGTQEAHSVDDPTNMNTMQNEDVDSNPAATQVIIDTDRVQADTQIKTLGKDLSSHMISGDKSQEKKTTEEQAEKQLNKQPLSGAIISDIEGADPLAPMLSSDPSADVIALNRKIIGTTGSDEANSKMSNNGESLSHILSTNRKQVQSIVGKKLKQKKMLPQTLINVVSENDSLHTLQQQSTVVPLKVYPLNSPVQASPRDEQRNNVMVQQMSSGNTSSVIDVKVFSPKNIGKLVSPRTTLDEKTRSNQYLPLTSQDVSGLPEITPKFEVHNSIKGMPKQQHSKNSSGHNSFKSRYRQIKQQQKMDSESPLNSGIVSKRDMHMHQAEKLLQQTANIRVNQSQCDDFSSIEDNKMPSALQTQDTRYSRRARHKRDYSDMAKTNPLFKLNVQTETHSPAASAVARRFIALRQYGMIN